MKTPRSRKAMIAYLSEHFRYDTMNSWNRATSYAARVKLSYLSFPSAEIRNRAYDLLQCEEAFEAVHYLIQEFAEDHGWRWQVGFNGRSSGYLVLYEGNRESSGYKSRCSRCGQLNYQTATAENRKCGKCGSDARYNIENHTRVVTYPGRGVDMERDYGDWSIDSLRSRVKLVMEFDQLVEDCSTAFINFCKNHVAEEVTVSVPTKVTRAKEL